MQSVLAYVLTDGGVSGTLMDVNTLEWCIQGLQILTDARWPDGEVDNNALLAGLKTEACLAADVLVVDLRAVLVPRAVGARPSREGSRVGLWDSDGAGDQGGAGEESKCELHFEGRLWVWLL